MGGTLPVDFVPQAGIENARDDGRLTTPTWIYWLYWAQL